MNGIDFVYCPLAGGFMFVNRRMVSGIMDRRASYCRTTYLVLFFNWNFFLNSFHRLMLSPLFFYTTAVHLRDTTHEATNYGMHTEMRRK